MYSKLQFSAVFGDIQTRDFFQKSVFSGKIFIF